MGNTRRRNVRPRKQPASVKAKYASQTTRYIPKPDPPSRNAFGPWRRVLQIIKTFDKTGINWISAVHFFDKSFGTTGFIHLDLHRVSIWGGVDETNDDIKKTFVSAALGNAHNFDSITGLVYKDYAPTKNSRAKIGFYVPSHLSQFTIDSDHMLQVQGDLQYIVEIDATFY